MKAKAIRSFIDKYTMKSIKEGEEIEITEERFSELTTGPRGIFVEEIKEESSKGNEGEKSINEDDYSDEKGENEETSGEKNQSTKENSKK